MKYVMINDDKPIIFFDIQNHNEFIRMGNITSAGFISIRKDDNGNILCKVYGKSTSLKLSPAEHDEEMINDLLNYRR